jgi:lipopolysaccharide heptosyltransferase II
VVLVPGARWLNKRWPAEYFAQCASRLASQRPELNFVILGSAGDRDLAEVISKACPEHCLDLTGQTSLPEMVEWVRLSRLVITNDTGPMHVAAALGKPLVALFGPTDPARTGPHGQLDAVLQVQDLPCVPCLRSKCSYREPLACLRRLTPEQVCARALERLRE